MRFVSILGAVVVVASLAACLPIGGKNSDQPNPLTGDTITTTALDAPPAMAENPASATETATEAKPETAAAPPPTAAPVPSPEETRCLKHGGTWASTGASGAKACVRPTGDAGKSCSKQSQCEGSCLARSRSCAPITPLFGCNAILQDDGREVTLCLD